MTPPLLPILLIIGIISCTIGSSPTLLDILRELKEDISDMKESVTVAIREENDKTLMRAFDRTAEESEAQKKVFEDLLSNLSLRVEQNLSAQTLRIEKIRQQLEDVQSVLTCAGEPPSPKDGRTLHFERKHGSGVLYSCDVNFVLAGNSTVRCHFGKWEGRPPLCARPATSALRAHLDTNNRKVTNVSCLEEEHGAQVHFSRLLDTGTGVALPTAARTYKRGRLAVLDLSGVSDGDKRGVFQCGHGNGTGMTFVIHRHGGFLRPKVASVGDTVQLGVALESDDWSYRWLQDGQRVRAWDRRGTVKIAEVAKEDAGVYELYEVPEGRRTQLFFRLVVRGCPAGSFGLLCDQKCPACINGGQCHEKLGTCVCPAGFEGKRCEEACGRGRIGPDCSEACDGGDCIRQLFCRQDPYGCSCAAGYKGYACDDRCEKGKFGADCGQICRCKEGSCDPYTGACSGGCSEGWTGASCQIPAGR